MSWDYKEVNRYNEDLHIYEKVLEHRYIAEQILNRKLDSEYVVHHKDCNRSNNSIDNLMIFKTQSDHARFHSGKYEKLICNSGVYECVPHYSICKACGKKFKDPSKNMVYCSRKCKGLGDRKVKDRPSKEVLLDLIQHYSYCAIGRMYGVSDNAIRKWVKSYAIKV